MTCPPPKPPTTREALETYASFGEYAPGAWDVLASKYPHKRVAFVVSRLADKGWVEWGTSMRGSWITWEGLRALKEMP